MVYWVSLAESAKGDIGHFEVHDQRIIAAGILAQSPWMGSGFAMQHHLSLSVSPPRPLVFGLPWGSGPAVGFTMRSSLFIQKLSQ